MPAKYNPDLPLVSIHVPKTGGSTVRTALQSWFGDNFRPHYVDEALMQAPDKHHGGAGLCIHGHFNRYRQFGTDDFYPHLNQFITFIRDPFEQHESLFFYLRREADKYKFNGQHSAIAGYDKFEDFMAYLADHREEIQTTVANTMLAHMPARFEKMDVAQMFGKAFIHLGTTVDLDASLDLLALKLNKPPLRVPPQNVSPHNLDVHAAHRRTHEKLFPDEHQFYQTVQALHANELRLAKLASNETVARPKGLRRLSQWWSERFAT